MDVHVYHVGDQGSPTVIPDASFRTEESDLIVNRDAEIIARFPAGKWSAAIRMDAPAQETR